MHTVGKQSACIDPKSLNDTEQCPGQHFLPSLRELGFLCDSTIQQMHDLGQGTYSSSGKLVILA